MDQKLIYRDDDINYLTCADELKRIHEPFARRGVVHTVAVEMFGLWENKSLWRFLNSDPLIEVGLHGWQHNMHSTMDRSTLFEEFDMSLEYWGRRGGRKEITTYYPTWNRVSPELVMACEDAGLKLSPDRSEYAWQFHYWEVTAEDVEDVLSGKMTGKEKQKQIKRNETAIA